MNYPDADDLYEGKFTDGIPANGIDASVASADAMNMVYDELINVVQAGGLIADSTSTIQVAQSIQQQIYSPRIFQTSGAENNLTLTTNTDSGLLPLTGLSDYDQITFPVTLTNTDVMTAQVDDLTRLSIANITGANQLLAGALATLTYLDGAFYLAQQINPKTGNPVNDIGELKVSTTDVLGFGEILLDGATLNRADYPIFWAKVQATSNLIGQATKDADLTAYAGYYGDGDGATTFTLPNLGGEFIRMADNGRGVDTDRVVGSWQEDAIRNIEASVQALNSTNIGQNATGAFKLSDSVITSTPTGSSTTTTGSLSFSASNAVPTADENRPRNIAYYAKTRV